MRRVGKRVTAREMRDCNSHDRAGAANAVDLLHHANYVIQMFDYVISMDFTKLVIGKWPRKHVQVMNNIRLRGRRNVQIDRAGQVLASTAKVQNVPLEQFRNGAWVHWGLAVVTCTVLLPVMSVLMRTRKL